MPTFKRLRLRLGPGDLIILVVIGVLALIIITGRWKEIFGWFYSPTSVVVVVIMLVEYLILKGSDRSAIYRRELEAAREKRGGDLLALRAMEARLVELRARLVAELERNDPQQLREAAEQARAASGELLALLRERI